MFKNNYLLISLVSLVALLARLLEHQPNFSPLIAVLLFAGLYGGQKKLLILPLVALFVSDLIIGFYYWPIMLSVYFSLLVVGLLGRYLSSKKNILNLLSAGLFSSLLFFLVTNWAVWYFGDWYSHSLEGLMASYTLAIPFFKQTILSTMMYGLILVGVYETALYFANQKKALAEKN